MSEAALALRTELFKELSVIQLRMHRLLRTSLCHLKRILVVLRIFGSNLEIAAAYVVRGIRACIK